jgi:M6 family metalloprotease-like protein
MKKAILFLLFTLVNIGFIYGYYEKNYPKKFVQPNGDTIQCYITGDEFYRRVHDENNFTIIRDHQTGYLVYAILENNNLVSSGYIVGEVNPAIVGLIPGLDIPPDVKTKIRQDFIARTPQQKDLPGYNSVKSTKAGQNNGTLNNLTIFIRFSDQSEFTTSHSTYEDMFNKQEDGYSSMYQYFKDMSYGQTFINTTFYPTSTGNSILSYQDIYPRSYYSPQSYSNPNGYDDDDYEERVRREHQLLKRALEYVKNQIPSNLDLDFDDDGYIDNICFIVKGNTDGWNDLLWPHKWSLYTEDVYLNGKKAWTFNFQLEDHLDYSATSVLCHEMFHSLGAPDLYHYSYEGVDPVGPWDLMCQNANPPQSTNMYMKYKYGGWIDEIPEITHNGTYTLNNVWSETNNCYKIASPNSTGYNAEYFVIEYRNKSIFWDSGIPGSGLIIYRINPKHEGNSNGPPDEIYIFREGGYNPNSSGQINNAHFSNNTGRTSFNDLSNPPCFLTNGTPGGINILNISSTGTTMSFTVNFDSNISVSTNSLNFGEIPVETISDVKSITVESFFLENPITYEITGANANLFSVIEGNDWNNLSGGTLNVIFSPNTTGTFNASLKISSIGVDDNFVSLTGEGIIIPIVADFESNRKVIFAGNSINFSDMSTGNPLSWNWTFDGGNPSSSNTQNPTVTYNTPGQYNVTLYVENNQTNDQKSVSNYVIVEDPDNSLICNNSFEYWTNKRPDCWYGTQTNFLTQTISMNENAYDGSISLNLRNNTSSFKRFSTQALSVEKNSFYEISFYAKGEGVVFLGLFDEREYNSGYSSDTMLLNINSNEWIKYTQHIKADNSTSNAEFVFFVRNTVASSEFLSLDYVSISKFDSEITLEEIGEVEGIEQCKGTMNQEILASLPSQVQLTDNLGVTHIVDITWNLSNINNNVAGTYEIVGTFELPDCLIQPNPPVDLEVKTTVLIQNVPEVICPDNMNVDANAVVELGGATPEGGVYSGHGITGNIFIASELGTGEYEITYTYTALETGCKSYCNFIIKVGANVETNLSEHISIYPNPTNGLLYTNSENPITIKMYTTTGLLLIEKTINKNNTLDVSNFSKGIYMINISENDGNILNYKIIIQ